MLVKLQGLWVTTSQPQQGTELSTGAGTRDGPRWVLELLWQTSGLQADEE